MGTVRFLLALCVVATHSPGGAIAGITLMSGITAVQCFYVVSGFLITMILNEKPEYKSIKNFYVSRYLRLWPIYALIAALTLLLFRRTFFDLLSKETDWPSFLFISFSNLTLFFQDWTLFLKFDDGGLTFTPASHTIDGLHPYDFLLVPQAWTLGVELTFYVIAPFVCRRWWSATGLLIFGTAARYLLVTRYHISLNSMFLYRFAPAEMMLFGGGAVSYFIGRSISPRLPALTRAVCFLLILLFSYMVFTNFSSAVSAQLLLWNYPILLLMIVAAPPLFYGTKNNPIDGFLGELSYPMYISHIFIYSMIASYLPASVQAGNVLYLVCVILLSSLLVVAVVKPLDRIRHRLGSPHGRRDRKRPSFEPTADIPAGDLGHARL
jgi:peptidoglycan/LPS O-acetylase OafA/YrhL